jgi:hypothetical protein
MPDKLQRFFQLFFIDASSVHNCQNGAKPESCVRSQVLETHFRLITTV